MVGLVEGVLAAHFYPRGSSYTDRVPFMLVDTFLIFVWYRNDSIARSFWPSRSLSVAVAGATILGLPYYLFRTRGLKGGAKASARFLLALLAYGALVAAAQISYLAFKT
jgi:hypothetical protein